MSHTDFQQIAQQLRQPQGEMGMQVGERMNETNVFINLLTIEELQLQPNDYVLEIGMGNGFFVPNVVESHASIHYAGCDFSETMVNEASQRNQAYIAQCRASFQVATAAQLPFPDNTFNKVFTINTIYFWEKPAEELAEIYRVLKPDGQLMIGIRAKTSMELLPFTQHGFRLYEGIDVAELLEANGFSVAPLLERDEPPQVVAGETVVMKTVLISGYKINRE